MVTVAAKMLSVRLEGVDSNGLLPLRAADKSFVRAFDFRRHLQRVLPAHLEAFPAADPLATYDLHEAPGLASPIALRWPPAQSALLKGRHGSLDALPIDHAVNPAAITGGHTAAYTKLKVFLKYKLPKHSDDHNHPELDSTSNLSPHLHFGHISSHQIFVEVARLENCAPKN
jgi:deoxyribodipyrimidine photo-lyase